MALPNTWISDDFSIEVTDNWTSPHSGAVYPAGWMVRMPGEELELEIKPLVERPGVECVLCLLGRSSSSKRNKSWPADSGEGYVELTGYSGSMGGQF